MTRSQCTLGLGLDPCSIVFSGESSSACPTQSSDNWRNYPLQVQLGEQWTCWGYLKEHEWGCHLQAHGWQFKKAVPLVPAQIVAAVSPEGPLSPSSCILIIQPWGCREVSWVLGVSWSLSGQSISRVDNPSLHIPSHQTHLNKWLQVSCTRWHMYLRLQCWPSPYSRLRLPTAFSHWTPSWFTCI